MASSNAICRIGVFYDGSFFAYARRYYYQERDLGWLRYLPFHAFIEAFIAQKEHGFASYRVVYAAWHQGLFTSKKATPEQKAEGWGDVWTWTALDADSKLLVSFRVGDRGPHACYEFVKDVAARLSSRERQVLALRFCDDMTQTQIAELIGVSQMQVSRILRRSIARLTELTEVQPPAS